MKNSQIYKMLMVLALVLSLVIIGVGVFNFVGLQDNDDNTTVSRPDSFQNEFFVIGRNPTAFQIENFNALTEALEADELDEVLIADLVTRAFIIDFFTWSNKEGSWDVGGQQFVYNHGLFFMNATTWYYAELDLFLERYGQENLPKVVSIQTNPMFAGWIEVDGSTFRSFYVEAVWEYEPNSILNPNQFQQRAYFTLINNQAKFEIISFFDAWD